MNQKGKLLKCTKIEKITVKNETGNTARHSVE